MIVLALGVTAAALAGGNFSNNDFQGHIEKDPGTFMGFDLDSGGSKVTHIAAGLKIQCNDGETGKSLLKGKGSLKVKGNGSFSGKMKTKPIQNRVGRGSAELFDGRLEVSGKLQKHGKAKGQVGGTFSFFLNRGGNKVHCYSGLVNWKAKKGATVNPVAQDPVRASG